jgi:hypothetical protein
MSIIIKAGNYEIEASIEQAANSSEIAEIAEDTTFCPYKINVEKVTLNTDSAALLCTFLDKLGYDDWGHFEWYWNGCILQDPSA